MSTRSDRLNGLICFANKYIPKYLNITENRRIKLMEQKRKMSTKRVIKEESENNRSEVYMEGIVKIQS